MNWGTRFFHSQGTTIDDSSSQSVLESSFLEGKLTAVGSGSITIDGFYYQNGKEYALGTYTWPYGIIGTVGLIRP